MSRKGKEEIGSRQACPYFFMGPGKLLSDTSKNMKNGFCKMAFIDEKRESTVMQSFVAYAKWLSFSCSCIVPFACPWWCCREKDWWWKLFSWICHASWWMGSEQIDLQLLPYLPLSFFSWTLLENQIISKTFFFFFFF